MSHTIKITWDTYVRMWGSVEKEVGHRIASSEFRDYMAQNKICIINRIIPRKTDNEFTVTFESEDDEIICKLRYL